MNTIIIEPTALAGWHNLVTDAEEKSEHHLGETLQSHVVFLLMRYLTRPEVVKSIFALEFLQCTSQCGQLKRNNLQAVGDKCLLFAGFYPAQANRRMVNLNYFVDMGRTAYSQVSDIDTKEKGYDELVEGFIYMMEVLQTIREMSGQGCLDILDKITLWQASTTKAQTKSLVNALGSVPVFHQGLIN